MNKYEIIPSGIEYPLAPATDQKVNISLESSNVELTEYDRSVTVSLAQVYDDERQQSTVFRPTFKINYVYSNQYSGTTSYGPFQNNLMYVFPEESKVSGVWRGFPQYYEFDFYRPNINDGHINYKSKSAYTYNWTYYLTHPFENDYEKQLTCSLSDIGNVEWIAKDGIPFVIRELGDNLIYFETASPHGLTKGEYVKLSFKYSNTDLFQVYSIGNGKDESDKNVFTIFNVGYTGTTFSNNTTGTFKRVIDPENLEETTSKYYVRKHKVISDFNDFDMVISGFENNPFKNVEKLENAILTPNNISRISRKTSNLTYNLVLSKDIDIKDLIDNQGRPLSELHLTIINRGYSGYFNKPTNNIGLKQGWEFNIENQSSPWWDENNLRSNSSIPVQSYQVGSRTFYYNDVLKVGDVIDGDFCEWNDFELIERVVSPYYQKIKFNQSIFQTTQTIETNAGGYYYRPHNIMTIRVFSDYIETAEESEIDAVPDYSFYSESNQEFRWRDIYTYGFIDELGRGVDHPYLNNCHYPFNSVVFKLIPEGINYNDSLFGLETSSLPLIDECE
jgi:hypothetical protein